MQVLYERLNLHTWISRVHTSLSLQKELHILQPYNFLLTNYRLLIFSNISLRLQLYFELGQISNRRGRTKFWPGSESIPPVP